MTKHRTPHYAPSTLSYSSVEQMPNAKGSALFITDSSKVFKDNIDITPQSPGPKEVQQEPLKKRSHWPRFYTIR